MIQEIQQNAGVVLRQVGLQVPIERSEIGSLTNSRRVILRRRVWPFGRLAHWLDGIQNAACRPTASGPMGRKACGSESRKEDRHP